MRMREIVWKQQFVEKLHAKHGVSIEETDEVLQTTRFFRKVGKGRVKGQDVYSAFGQTWNGRYLVIVFINKGHGSVLPISARDMDRSERKLYEKNR